jgi:hypothetical protein
MSVDQFWPWADILFQLIAVLIGLAFAALGARSVGERWHQANNLIVQVEARLASALSDHMRLSAEVERIDLESIDLARQYDLLQGQAAELEQSVTVEALDLLPAVFVGFERKTEGDIEYRTVIKNARLPGDWAIGREYVVWSRSAEYALRVLRARFPEVNGYEYGSVKAAVDPLC